MEIGSQCFRGEFIPLWNCRIWWNPTGKKGRDIWNLPYLLICRISSTNSISISLNCCSSSGSSHVDGECIFLWQKWLSQTIIKWLQLYCWWSRSWSICVEFTPFVPKWFCESSCCPFRQVHMFTRWRKQQQPTVFEVFPEKHPVLFSAPEGNTHTWAERIWFSPLKNRCFPQKSGKLSRRFLARRNSSGPSSPSRAPWKR